MTALPWNPEAEMSVLGTCLRAPDAIASVIGLLKPSDFFDAKHRDIYLAMRKLYQAGSALDAVTLADALGPKLEKVGGEPFLASLVAIPPLDGNIMQYAEIVHRHGVLRGLARAGSAIAALGTDADADAIEALSQAEMELAKVGEARQGQDYYSLAEIMHGVFSQVETAAAAGGALTGVPMGLTDLEAMTNGLQAGDLILLGAFPSVGKTAMAGCICHHAARKGFTCGFFSAEMSKEQLGKRFLALDSGVDAQRIRAGTLSDPEWDAISNSMGRLSELPIYVEDTPGISIGELTAKARRMHRERRLDLLVVDYIQLLGGTSENRVNEIAGISRQLKSLARSLGVPILALSQLNRRAEERGGDPSLSDLKESSQLGQDADVVIILQRDVMQEEDGIPNPESFVATCHVIKQRNGPTGKVRLFYDTRRMRFADLRDDRTPVTQLYQR